MTVDALAILRKMSGQENIYTIPKLYVQLLGCTKRAMILNQIIFFSDKSTALKDGWFYKSYEQWSEETSIPLRSVERIMKELVDSGYIDRKSRKIKGVRTAVFRPKMDEILSKLSCIINEPNRQNGVRAKPPKWRFLNTNYTEDTSEELPEDQKDASIPSESKLTISKELEELIEVWNDLAVKAGCPKVGNDKRVLKDLQRYTKAIKENWNKELTQNNFAWLIHTAIREGHYMFSKFQQSMQVVMRWKNFEDIYNYVLQKGNE